MPAHSEIKPGTKFGKWTVLCRSEKRGEKIYYTCKCECGLVKNVHSVELRKGKSNSCRSCVVKHTPIEPGTKFGSWTVVGLSDKVDQWYCYICKCECGTESIVRYSSLKCNMSTRCVRCGNTKINASLEYRMLTSGQKCVYLSYTRGAKARGLPFELTIAQFLELTSSNCAYCGLPPSTMTKDYTFTGIDRVNNDIGYVFSNCVPCCKACNIAKNDMSYSEWIAYIKRLTQHQNRKARQHTTADTQQSMLPLS